MCRHIQSKLYSARMSTLTFLSLIVRQPPTCENTGHITSFCKNTNYSYLLPCTIRISAENGHNPTWFLISFGRGPLKCQVAKAFCLRKSRNSDICHIDTLVLGCVVVTRSLVIWFSISNKETLHLWETNLAYTRRSVFLCFDWDIADNFCTYTKRC